MPPSAASAVPLLPLPLSFLALLRFIEATGALATARLLDSPAAVDRAKSSSSLPSLATAPSSSSLMVITRLSAMVFGGGRVDASAYFGTQCHLSGSASRFRWGRVRGLQERCCGLGRPMQANAKRNPKLPAQLTLDTVSPATRLLEKRRQMFEVQEALDAQKEDFER